MSDDVLMSVRGAGKRFGNRWACRDVAFDLYPGEVLARHYVGEMGRSTVDTFATLERSDQPGVVYATGGATVVWTDFKAQKSMPIPDDFRALLARY